MGGELIAARAIHRIAWREPRHTRSDGFNGAGEIDTQNRVPGSKPAQEPNEEWAPSEDPVAKTHARRADADERLVVGGRRCRYLPDLHHLRRSIARRDSGPHSWMRIRRKAREVHRHADGFSLP